MGKLTLLFVMVAILGGSLLTFRTQMASNETGNERIDAQSDALARDAAASGHSLILNAMVGTDGFASAISYNDESIQNGRFVIDDYTVSSDNQHVSFAVTGHAGGATHTIQNTYEWDPIEFPGPIWIDAPYAAASVGAHSTIDGGSEARAVHFDTRRYDELDLRHILPWESMNSTLAAQFAQARGNGGELATSDMKSSGLLEDLNVGDATELYNVGIAAMSANDVTVTGPRTYSTTIVNFGPDRKIVRVTGGLTINNAIVQGKGLLIVEGPLTLSGLVPTLRWDGIVLVHSEDMYVPVDMSGTAVVDVSGALIVDHEAIPPGGHMDLTIMRGDSDGNWPDAGGINSRTWFRPNDAFYEHKHKFDVDLPEGRHVYFAEEGRDRHERYTWLRQLLNEFGSTEVYLEFANEGSHGHANFTLDIEGSSAATGIVAQGFGTYASGSDVYRTITFPAKDLNTFTINVQSLRTLKKRWDQLGGCPVAWPLCIADDWNRGEALSVRIVRASDNQMLYEASIYWHMREDEVEQHEREEQAIRDMIQDGNAFGADIVFGNGVSIKYNIREIKAIGSLLGFDNDSIVNTASSSYHITAAEYRTQGFESGLGGGPGSSYEGEGGPPAPRQVLVCHSGSDVLIDASSFPVHLSHGDTEGGCGPAAPPDQMWICHHDGPSSSSILINIVDWILHLLHGDQIGQCS